MAEPIEFPLNFSRYIEIGKEAMNLENFTEAELNFTKAYNLEEDFNANLFLVESLVAQSKFQEALAIANEMKIDYVKAFPLFKIYFRLLLGNGEFIQSRKLLKQLKFSRENMQELALEIEQGEQIFRLYQQQELNILLKKKEQLVHSNFFQQGEILKSWQKLPLEHYIKLANEVIEGDQVNLLLRTSLLNDLVELDSDKAIELKLLNDEKIKVIPCKLNRIENQQSFKAATMALTKQFANEDSDLSRQLQEELRLQFSILYPVADEWVKEPGLWVSVFLRKYLGEEIEAPKELFSTLEKYRDLQEKISQELIIILGF